MSRGPARPRLSVIVPFLNESANMDALRAELEGYFAAPRPYEAEVVLVDDGSTDDSVARWQARAPRSFSSRVVSLSRNFGSHAALRAGLQHATGDWHTFLYADLQDPPQVIDQLWVRAQAGADIVWAQRRSLSSGLFERAFSVLYARLMQLAVSPLYPTRGFDVVLFSARVQRELGQQVEANSSIFLQILTLGFRQEAVEYDKKPRRAGRSKWTFGKKVKLLVDSFVAFSYLPLRAVTLAGLGLAAFGAVWGGYVIARTLLMGDLSPGWPALIATVLLGFGLTNVSLGVIAEYVWRTLDAARGRPAFVIERVVEVAPAPDAAKEDHVPA